MNAIESMPNNESFNETKKDFFFFIWFYNCLFWQEEEKSVSCNKKKVFSLDNFCSLDCISLIALVEKFLLI
jgi:hypothetical protein